MMCASASHAADTYPSKPGRLILPFGAGASTDIVGRIFALRFSEAWGQTLVVDNRPGAAGVLGTELASKAAPDGYTIFTYGINQTITPNLYNKLPYVSSSTTWVFHRLLFGKGCCRPRSTSRPR